MAMGNPFKTGPSFKNSFNIESDGLTQGDAQDDPAIRLTLAAGVVSDAVDGSLWGGMGIIAMIPPSDKKMLGSVIIEATQENCNGFCVFNQAHHGVITPNSGVPQYMAGNGIHFYRLGCGARIPLPVSAAVAALANSNKMETETKFAWDPDKSWIDVAATDGMSIRLLYVSPSGNMAAKQDPTTKDVNWDDAPLGLFLI